MDEEVQVAGAGAKKGVGDDIPVSDQGLHQLLVCTRIAAERCARRFNGAFKYGDSIVVERVRQRSRAKIHSRPNCLSGKLRKNIEPSPRG